MPARGPWIDHFGDNFLWSNATLIIKGMAPYGVVALEEMDRACERLRLRQHEPQAWWEEWGALAAQVERAAEATAAAGRKHTAGDYYLRAGNYYYNAERFILPAMKSANGDARPIAATMPASSCAIRTSSSSRCPMRAQPCLHCS